MKSIQQIKQDGYHCAENILAKARIRGNELNVWLWSMCHSIKCPHEECKECRYKHRVSVR
jgi:hypothetical protein